MRYNPILLSDEGKAFAKKVFERHLFFLRWFEHIGIDKETAKEDACLIEHAISDTTFEKIMDYLQKVDEKAVTYSLGTDPVT